MTEHVGRPRRGALEATAYITALLGVIILPFIVWGEEVEGRVSNVLESPPPAAGLAAIVILLLAADIFIPVPSSIVCLGAGALLGVYEGAICGALGLSIGCAVGFSTARLLHRPANLASSYRQKSSRMASSFNRHGLLIVALCRPLPVLAEGTIFIAGALGAPFVRTMLIAMFANAGVAGSYAFLGALFGRSFANPLALLVAIVVALTLSATLIPVFSWLKHLFTDVGP